jgi:hypothetical protein
MPICHLRELIFQELTALSLSTKRQTTSQMAPDILCSSPRMSMLDRVGVGCRYRQRVQNQ